MKTKAKTPDSHMHLLSPLLTATHSLGRLDPASLYHKNYDCLSIPNLLVPVCKN
ncbi:hypothetical protein BS47DRAFT_1351960 [Hydnum rufescens UP504]|uniref:Uncharacterized protein n=1 Tax=Hydnum rufescens UP504 TaxID=1448309 RepID=A0A9P6AJZ4_9AGAM|nr:hypothetical protein BS47DRAFT_1351960 [Hydnum rufescens UP504]